MSKPPIPSVASALAALTREARLLGAAAAEPVAPARIPIEDAVVKLRRPPACPGYGRERLLPAACQAAQGGPPLGPGLCRGAGFQTGPPPGRTPVGGPIPAFPAGLRDQRGAGSGLPPATDGRPARAWRPAPVSPSSARQRIVLCSKAGERRRPDLARPSMEALGINVFRLARGLGWQIHPIGRDSDPAQIPSAMLAGLVLLG